MINNETRSLENKKDWKLVNFCEFDKYAIKSYCAIHNVDESLNLGDITKVDETKLESFNMICGGSPCQDFSVAGKQKGSVWTCKECGHEYNPLTVHWSKRDKCPNCNSENIEKTRSSLLVEYLRVIRANKPNFGMYENVKNIVGKQFRDTTFKLFEDELHEYGYNTYWKVLNAKDYGIPQNRERVYLIFIKKELDNGKFIFPEGFDNGIRLKDVLEDEVDEKYYISDDKVQRFLTNLNSGTSLLYDPCQVKREGKSREYNDYCPTLTSRDYKDPRLINENIVKQVGNISNCNDSWKNPQVGRIYSVDGCSPTLNTCGGGSHEPKILQVGNVNPSGKGMNGNVFSDDGLAPTLTTNKGEGNKVFINERFFRQAIETFENNDCNIGDTIDAFNKRVNTSGYSPTITTRPEGFKTAILPVVGNLNNIKIRKLTPKECFRLMGFDDFAYDAVSKVASNSQLYKQAGNSIVVDVLYYILIELYKTMPYLFDDLRLSSFFSGIGAFECSLDLLYKRIIRFDRSELNIKECEICGSNLRVKHNKTTNMFLCEKHCKQIYNYGKITNPSSYNQNEKNKIEIYDKFALLVLKNINGEIVGKSIIDLDDIDVVKQYKWSLGNHGYVTSGCGKNQILLHRLLSNAPSDLYVDHINRNKLDNRKLNYRFCTNQENNRNKDLYSHNSSGITGVTWNKERNKWQSQIVVDNKNINLGRFDLFDDAVNARLMAEEKYFKDFMPENRNGLYESINTGNFINPQVE